MSLTDAEPIIVVICWFFAIMAFLVYLFHKAQRKTIERQQETIDAQSITIERICQAAMAYKASSEVNPALGPAVLQKTSKFHGIAKKVPEVEKPDSFTGDSKQESGVTIHQGMR